MRKEPAMAGTPESASQDYAGIIDTGADSFAVDTLSNVEIEDSDKPEISASAKGTQDVDPDKEGQKGKQEEESTPDESEVSTDDKQDDIEDEEDKSKDEEDESEEEYSKRVQKRIGKLNTKRRAAEKLSKAQQEKIDTLEKKLEAMESGKDKSGKPDMNDYDDEEDYYEAIADWKAEKKIAKAKADEATKKAEKAAQKEVDKIESHKVAGVKKYKDFEKAIDGLELERALLPAINEMKNAPDVIYYLGKNSDIADSINDLISTNQPLLAGMKLNKIASSLKGKTRSKAPAPIKPVRGSSKGGVKSIEEMTNAEYRAYRDKQDKSKRLG